MNSDHRDNIGTHPAFSKDPETALRARLDAAQQRKNEADRNFQKARDNLRVFLASKAEQATEPEVYVWRDPSHDRLVVMGNGSGWWASEPTLDPETAAWDYLDDAFDPRRGVDGAPLYTLSNLVPGFGS